jgi:hypothetical protein
VKNQGPNPGVHMWTCGESVQWSALFKLTGTSGPRHVSSHLVFRHLDYTTLGSLSLSLSLSRSPGAKSQGSKYEHVARPCDVKSSEADWHCDTSLLAPGFSTPRLHYVLFSPSPLALATRTRSRSQAQCFFFFLGPFCDVAKVAITYQEI